MKATGIVRRIDDLGRIVIPKEIRRTMRIREGDPLEIYTEKDGEVIFKKYSPIGELAEFADQYAEVLYKTGGRPAVICDRDRIVAVSGAPKKELLERQVSSELDALMTHRKGFTAAVSGNRLRPVDGVEQYAEVCQPIVSSGDISGAVMYLSDGKGSSVSDPQEKLIEAAAAFLGKQLDH